MTTSAAVVARTERATREAAPFVKWVGGKGRILSQLWPLLAPGVEQIRYVEPFVGGGALSSSRRPRRALLADINPSLVAAYTAIRDDVEAVVGGLRRLASRHSKQSYYEVRERYNQSRRVSTSTRAAMFIYLNKTCFQDDGARGKRRKAARVGESIEAPRRQEDDVFTRRARLSWAKLIRRVYEVDPLLCPLCGSEMRILAFIVDFGAAKAIRKSLKLPAQEPEPLAHASPETLELIAESA